MLITYIDMTYITTGATNTLPYSQQQLMEKGLTWPHQYIFPWYDTKMYMA